MIISKITHFFQSISVEPIGFLAFIIFNVNRLASTVFALQAVCLQKYGNETVDCSNLTKEMEDEIQKEAVMWVTMIMAAALPFTLVANLILGKTSRPG